MRSISKILGLLLIGILVLLTVAGFAITHILDPNDYKDEIRQLVREKTNLELQLNGKIGWSLFPWLGIEVTDVQLAQTATPEEPFADLRLLGLSVRVLPLLRKEIQMSDIRIDGLNLTLHRDSKGGSNWNQTSEQQTKNNAESIDKTNKAAVNTSASKLDVDSLIVNSARIDYRDEQTKQRLTLENVQITTGTISQGRDIPIKISGFIANTNPLIRAQLEMVATAQFDLQLQRYQLNDLKMTGEFAGEPLNGKSVNFSARGNLLLDQSTQTAQWEQLRLSLNQLKAMGDIRVKQLNETPQFQGTLAVTQVNLKEFLQGIGAELPQIQNSKALSRFEFSSDFTGGLNTVRFDNANIVLDQTTLTGNFGSTNLEKSAFFATLKGDSLNLDDYLPPESKPAAKPASDNKVSGIGNNPLPQPPTENPWATQDILPLPQLRQLNLDFNVQLEQLTVRKLPWRQVAVSIKANQGQISLPQMQAKLYEGGINATAALNAKTDIPQFTLDSEIYNIPVEKLLTALEQDALFEGQLGFKGNFTTQGNSERTLVKNLNGNSTFFIDNGKLSSVNVDQYLCSAIATLNRKTMTQGFNAQHTSFNELRGSLSIRNGLMHNPDLYIGIPSLSVKGKGDLDLNVLGLDYKIGATLLGDTREMPDSACAINKRYIGLELPIRCRGSFAATKPSCQVDQDGLGKIAAKLAGEKLTEKLDEKLGEKVSPELKDALKGLFKR